MFRLGEPNLSKVEATRSAGVWAIFYADEDDYRIRAFTEDNFWDMPICCEMTHICCEEPGDERTYGQRWAEGEPVTITEEHVRDWYVPALQRAWAETRAAIDEPPHFCYEVWWKGVLVWQGRIREDGEVENTLPAEAPL